jgi:rsbT co-antagonist protein RsbR
LRLSPVGVCEWRPGEELLEINDQYVAMVGYTKEEVFEMGWKNLTPSEYQGDLDRLHQENALRGINKTYRKEYFHKDGHRVPIYLVTEPIFDNQGRLDRYISHVQDLTEIKKAEQAIEQEQKLQELVEVQQQTIKELSTPVIPIWSKVLMAGLLGSFDSMRMHDLSEKLLNETAAQKPRAVLLDLSGLAYVDTQVISEIVRLIASLRFLGAKTILSGIGPRIAQSLIHIGANLDGVLTYANLEQALKSLLGASRA